MRKGLMILSALLLLPGAARADTIIASVNGLVCAFCATGIKKTFRKLPAVDSIKVDLDNKLVTISTKPRETLDDNTVTNLINNAGYAVTGIRHGK